MDEFKKYLADQILSEEKIVTYRSLSRALKVHVNTAKGMLYEFHRSQNGMRPGTIHATYLIYGIQKAEKVQEDGDIEMTSSPPDAVPLSDEVLTHSLTLVPGDRLKEILASYEELLSFHIYSLARHPTRELQMLADVSQQIKEQSTEDSASMAETYGTIINPNVRKRDRQGRPVPAPPHAATAAKPVKKESAPSTVKPAASAPKTEEPAEKEIKVPAKDSPSSAAATIKKGAAPPSLKKSGSSGIMSSFAKAAAKASSKPKETPKPESPAALSDDGEDDDDDIPAAKSSGNTGRKSRKDREAELKQMMEESEEEEEPEEDEEEPADEPMEETPGPEAKPEPEPAEVVSSTSDGRRRGKRRVMKKKQIMDDQGYLVTIQEPAWEEFSEDEAPPPPAKAKSSSAPSSGSQTSKGKKAAPKGQGNIMSFFSKK
ncbi:Putative DNA polymerase delta subunit 3 [Colletotrichum destructivum]|uniref:DNA polymerase delta subunit 3 n=1 Tax=Colletotrichum destructivum TaxID=34406 RepID=A0AAX4IAZ9_9PEZI|nr:Putative DNA polymerase delta subunit 3 [Colletotrichum destructivum]